MHHELIISQILLPKPETATAFVSLYEETIRHDQPVSLFLICEIPTSRKLKPIQKKEYEKLVSSLARTLKQVYLQETKLTELTFERALTEVNNHLSSIARRGVVGWYRNLNALLAAYTRQTLFVSTTGSCSAYLLRGREFTRISDVLPAPRTPQPIKTFASFTHGTIAENDYLLFSTAGLYNYISLDKIRTTLKDTELGQATKEIMSILKKDAPTEEPFASFLCKASTRLTLPDHELHPLMAPVSHTIIDDPDTLKSPTWERIGKSIPAVSSTVRSIFAKLRDTFFSVKRQTWHSPLPAASIKKVRLSKKILLIIGGIALVILVITLLYTNLNKARERTRAETKTLLETAVRNIAEAEAALIYENTNRVLDTATKAKEQGVIIEKTSLFERELKELKTRIEKVFGQLNKSIAIPAPERLADFSIIPDQLIRVRDGFVGFNAVTGAFEFFDSKTAVVRPLADAQPSPERFAAANPLSATSLLVVARGGNQYELRLAESTLKPLGPMASSSNRQLLGLEIFSGRGYTIDTAGSQILRFTPKQSILTAAQPWLRSPAADMARAQDVAVDGSIYVLLPNTVEKFTRGEKQTFSLPQLSEPLREATKIWTDQLATRIYIAEPNAKRILVLNKQGGLVAQLTSPHFAQLQDLWVEDAARMVYSIIGNQLVKFSF